ncbi:MAG TPA: retropepsin-like aspartic protease [Acetobacteraceae bacterium]|nr:retropepsin-like aspartic protease [Acetobacteraceae bacterium]
MLRTALIGGLLLCLAACAAPPAPGPQACSVERVADLPTQQHKGAVLVPASINQTPVLMQVDTGTSLSTVSPGFASAYALPPDPHRHTVVHGIGGEVTTRNTLLWSFEVGGQLWTDQSFVTSPLARTFNLDEPVAGLFAADFLSDFDVELDLPHHRITLWQVNGCAGDFAFRGVPHWRMPLRRYQEAQMVAPVTVDGQQMTALLDWGANVSVIKQSVAARLGVTAEQMQGDPVRKSRGADGNVVEAHVHRFPDLRIGPATFHNVRLEVAPIHDMNVDMLLGLNYARSRDLWLSYATDQLFVVRPVRPGAPRAQQATVTRSPG